MCILCTVWLARDPEWEALIALLGAFGTYVGLELTQRGEPASQSDDGCTVECAARVEHETEHRILQHLATEGASDMAELIAALGLTQFEAEHYCGRLELIGYVTTSTARVYRRQYRLTRRAKEYVRQQRVAQREFRLPDTACNLATAGSKDPSAVTAMNRRSRDRFAE